MPYASSDLPSETARREQRRYLFDMMEQLAAMAVAAGEKEVADVLFALVAVYGDTARAATEGEG